MSPSLEAALDTAALRSIDLVTLQAMRDEMSRRLPGYIDLGITLLVEDYRNQLARIEREIRSRLRSPFAPIDGRVLQLSAERQRDVAFVRQAAALRGAL